MISTYRCCNETKRAVGPMLTGDCLVDDRRLEVQGTTNASNIYRERALDEFTLKGSFEILS